MAKQQEYSGSDIEVYRDAKHVRKRPAMYIGDVGERGLHHCIWEVVDNSIDEHVAGFCDKITIELGSDGSVTVSDNGRGIPVDMHAEEGKSALELVLTVIGAGGKFNKKSYAISGGLHGVGVSAVCALSSTMVATVKRDSKVYQQEFAGGYASSAMKEIGTTNRTGTSITFVPDNTIFDATTFDTQRVLGRARELAYLNSGLVIHIVDRRDNTKFAYKYDNGIVQFVEHLNEGKHPLHDVVYFEGEQDGIRVEVAFQFNSGFDEKTLSFVNNIPTIEGGTHLVGFRNSLSRVLLAAAKETRLPKGVTLTGEDTREGVVSVISAKVPEPQFEGQTKTKLGNKEVQTVVHAITSEGVKSFFEEHPKELKLVIGKVKKAAEAREASRRARESVRESAKGGMSELLSKLVHCRSKDVESNEVLLIEGDSAGGSAKGGRDSRFQAVLPMKGKVLNVEKATVSKMLAHDELKILVSALGTGLGEAFDLSKLKYGKVIIMCDADVDGLHIQTLLLTFFFRQMTELLLSGHVYIAQPPLYRVTYRNKTHYLKDDTSLQTFMKENEVNRDQLGVQRFKGLGEMNPDQLWDTTMSPANRTVRQVIVGDAVEACRVFDVLMGKAVEPRRQFIVENAAKLDPRFLDV